MRQIFLKAIFKVYHCIDFNKTDVISKAPLFIEVGSGPLIVIVPR